MAKKKLYIQNQIYYFGWMEKYGLKIWSVCKGLGDGISLHF